MRAQAAAVRMSNHKRVGIFVSCLVRFLLFAFMNIIQGSCLGHRGRDIYTEAAVASKGRMPK